MSNEEQVNKIKENMCETCIFQVDGSCMDGVIDRLAKAEKPVDFCILHRPNETDLKGRSVQKYLEVSKKACSNKYGIILFDESDNDDDVAATIQSIINCNYDKGRMKVVISIQEQTLLNRGSSMSEYLQNYYNLATKGILCELTFHRPNMPVDVMETDVFQKIVQSTHFVNLNAGSVIDRDMFGYIDKKRENMEKIIVCRDENEDITCIPKSVAKNFYLNYNDYRLMSKDLQKEAAETGTYFKYEKPE